MIKVEDVSYAYPGADTFVFEGLNLHIKRGVVAGVVGASGVGKTTLAKILSGFIPHVDGGELEGTVHVDGEDVASAPLAEIVATVGLVIQNPFNQISGAKYTVREEIAFGLENFGVPRPEMEVRVAAVAELLRISHLLERSPYELSGGQQQLVAIASMIVLETPVIVMDEPTSQLDPAGTRMVFDAIASLRENGVTVVIFEHKLELLEKHCDEIFVVADRGIVTQGQPHAALSDPRLETWGVGPTRYTRAARAAKDRGVIAPDAAIPVSYGEAVEVFRAVVADGGGEVGAPDPGPTDPALTDAAPTDGRNPDPASIGPRALDPAQDVVFRDVRFQYPSGFTALEGVSLRIEAGEKVAIVGQNGAGKTTLVRHLNGIFKPTSGDVLVGDWNSRDHEISSLARRVGYAFQNPDEQIFARTVLADVSFGPQNLGLPADEVVDFALSALEMVGLAGEADTHPHALSLSERKKVTLAGVLAMKTPIVVLDEPTTGQDYRGVEIVAQLVESLHEQGRTVITITHDMDFCAEVFDRVIVMSEAKVIADGRPETVFSQPDILRRAAIEPPQLVRLAGALGLPSVPLNVSDFVNHL